MLEAISTFDLAHYDLRGIFTVSAFVGFVLLVYIAQKSSEENLDLADPAYLRWMARIGRYSMALCLMWMVRYSFDRNWQPWPPMVAGLWVFDFMLIARAWAIWLHAKRMKQRWPTGLIRHH